MPESAILVPRTRGQYKARVGGLHTYDVVVGGKRAFRPTLRLNRWDGECQITLSYPTTEQGYTFVQGDRVTWFGTDVDVVMYPKAPNLYEYEVILKRPPKSNILRLDFESEGLDFFKQPPEPGRPANIVNSYAVYKENRSCWHNSPSTADKYRCGKAFHIYRPWLCDAAGWRTWADIEIDTRRSEMLIIMDANWLAKAAYPVIVDPTFGYTSIGGTPFFMSVAIADVRANTRYTASAGEVLETLHVYNSHALGDDYYMADIGVYTFSGGVPVTRVTGSVNISSDSGGNWASAVATDALSGGVEHCVAIGNDQAGNCSFFRDNSGTVDVSVESETGALPATWAEDTAVGIVVSMYATYAEAPSGVRLVNEGISTESKLLTGRI